MSEIDENNVNVNITGDMHMIMLNGSRYIKDSLKCKTCEFIPPCRLCTWVSREVFNWVYNEDAENMMKHNKKWHLREKRHKMRLLGLKENKGRGNGSQNYKMKGKKKGIITDNKPDVMTI